MSDPVSDPVSEPASGFSADSLFAVFSDGLGVPADLLSDETSPDNTPQWDSLAAMTLVSLIGIRRRATATRDSENADVGLARSVLSGKVSWART